ncbi:MAG: chromosome segregation protein ScpA [Candidatus Methanomethylophilaceae archaeon]
MSKEAETEAVLNHLLFHKALIDEDQDDCRMDRYLEILSEAEAGEALSDPMDESIRAVFHLVLNQGFDPWDIDLMEFTRLYAGKIKDDGVDLIVAGRLMHMAWSVLRLQSEETLLENDREDELFFFDWETDGFQEMEQQPKLCLPAEKLKESPRRTPTRPVSLMELLEAFEEARVEAELMQARERSRRELKTRPARDFRNNAHEEDMEQDVERVWGKVQMIGAGPISMTDLFSETLSENISTFLAVLYLVRDGRLALWQDDLPHGEIYLEMKVDWASGMVENAPQAEVQDKMTVI